MSAVKQLDGYTASYTPKFPHFEENFITHVAYGERIADYIRSNDIHSAMSLGIGHTEVAQRILATINNGPLRRYVVVDGSRQIIEGFFETFAVPHRFDIIEAGFILEHVDDPAFILRRLHEFLAPGGRIFLAVPNARSLHRQLGHMAGLLDDMYVLSPSDFALGHKRYFDVEAISTLIRDAGFDVAKTEGMFLKPFTTGQLNTLNLPPAVWQALMKISAGYPDLSNAIYIEATA